MSVQVFEGDGIDRGIPIGYWVHDASIGDIRAWCGFKGDVRLPIWQKTRDGIKPFPERQQAEQILDMFVDRLHANELFSIVEVFP